MVLLWVVVLPQKTQKDWNQLWSQVDRIKQAQNRIWNDNEAACDKTNWARKQDRDECQIQDLDNGKFFSPSSSK